LLEDQFKFHVTKYVCMIQPDVYWIREIEELRLAIMPRPRNGEWLADEISGWHRMGLRNVVSLLEIDESRELGLADEESMCGAAGLQFLSFPIPDRGVPRDHTGFAELVDNLAERLRSGDSVGIHCRAGIGRSGLLGACILGAFEVPPESAFAMLSRDRGVTVPDTDAQADWVRNFVRTRSKPNRH
jgi:protein-tyrosine phosphatase